jgi:hypothetical protein
MGKCNDFPAVVLPLRPVIAPWVAFVDKLMLSFLAGNLAIWIYLQL